MELGTGEEIIYRRVGLEIEKETKDRSGFAASGKVAAKSFTAINAGRDNRTAEGEPWFGG